jgi:protein tyrosine phosphatase (PTP) superfamily phosphohydrolase (DUF442 family)/predicted ester cyclase
MSRETDNKAIVGRWFEGFWTNPWNPKIIDELAAPDILLQYSLHAPRRGREDVRKFIMGFREAFPDLNFWGAADLIAEGDYVVGRWEGGGTHTGPAFSDFLAGSLPAASGRKMRFTGTTVLRVENGKIAEEIGRRRDRASAAWYPKDSLTRNGPGELILPARSPAVRGYFMADPETIYHWHRPDDRITTSGQPTEPQLEDIHALAVRHIVNLGLHRHEKALEDETANVSRLGMTYIHIPVDFQNPTDQDFDQFCAVMERLKDVPVHVHCIANYRVSAFFYRYRRDVLGVDEARARVDMEEVWHPEGVWAAFVSR